MNGWTTSNEPPLLRKPNRTVVEKGDFAMLDNCCTAYGSRLTDSMIAHVSKWVLPVDQPPIREGAVVVQGDRIAAVGPAADILSGFTGLICDHGDGAILPGVVNCHVHLEFSALAGKVAPQEPAGRTGWRRPWRPMGRWRPEKWRPAWPGPWRRYGGAARYWWGR